MPIRRALALAAVLLALSSAPGHAGDARIQWRTDLAGALAEAGDRKVLVYFFEHG